MTGAKAARLVTLAATLFSCFAVECPQKSLVCPDGITCLNRTNLCEASAICPKSPLEQDDGAFPVCVDSRGERIVESSPQSVRS